MSVLQEDMKPSAKNIMYIRGIPYEMWDAAGDGPPHATPKRASSSAKTTAVIPMTGFCRAEAQARAGLMKSRRTVRVFSGQIVPVRLLRELMSTAWGGNPKDDIRLARFVMVEAASSMARVAGLTAAWLRREGLLLDSPGADAHKPSALFNGAPHVAVLYGPNDAPGAAAACSMALARLEWAAAGAGLGTCFADELVQAAACDSEVAAALAIPDGHTAFGALLLGYPYVPAGHLASGRRSYFIWL
jgi:hypothetical protein